MVVGILIALYINNWNEQRKEQQKFNSILIDVELELVDNIKNIRSVIDDAIWYDSICLNYSIDSVKFEKGFVYGALLDVMHRTALKDVSLQRLSETNGVTKEQQSILEDLIDLNTSGRLYLDDYGNHMVEIAKSNMESFKRYNWYNSYMSDNYDDESFLDFATKDPDYSKLAMMLFMLRSGYTRDLAVYHREAMSAYLNIYNYLDSLGIRQSDSLFFQYDPEDYKHYLGKYDSKWSNKSGYTHQDSIVISLEENKLIYKGFRSGRPSFQTKIIPVNKFHFWEERSGAICHFEFDDQGEVKGIRCSNGPRFILKIEKVR